MTKVVVDLVATGEKREVVLDGTSPTVLTLLKALDMQKERVVVRRNLKVLIEEEALFDGDRVEIIPIISGG